MNKIVSIKNKNKDTYIIEVDSNQETETHIVTENTMIKHRLLQDRTLSNEEYQSMIKDNEYEMLYLKAIHFLSYQMRTIAEVKTSLKKTTKNNQLIQKVIQELKSNNYLNDAQFVTQYVSEKIEFDLVGPKYIKDRLIKKGVHYDLIEQALQSYTEDMQFDKIFQIIQKETAYKQKKPFQKVYLSLKQKLITKGFQLNIIESALLSQKEVIEAQIDEVKLLEMEYQKLIKSFRLEDFNEKTKFIQKLMGKGFRYEDILTLLNKE